MTHRMAHATILAAVALSAVLASSALADGVVANASVPGLVSIQCGAPVTLTGTPDYGWWYGCSPTSTGMLMAYYAIHGYQGATYTNLIPGGATPDMTAFPVYTFHGVEDTMIASTQYINDYYSGDTSGGINDVNKSGDDVANPGANNCLGDFMGTSQDKYGNSDGSTSFYWMDNGTKLDYTQDPGFGISGTGSVKDGMYGIYQYIAYCGYGADVKDLYSQASTNLYSNGFSFANLEACINAGEPVLLNLESESEGHTVLAYGYDASSDTVYIRDTWVEGGWSNGGTMTWTGTYDGMAIDDAVVLSMDGGSGTIPEPISMIFFGTGLAAVGGYVARRKAHRN